jgi:hypothetical protein
MKVFQKSILLAALCISTAVFAQNTQWQLQISTPQPAPIAVLAQPQGYAVQPAAPVAPTVETIQAQHDARIRWAAQRGLMSEPDYRRLVQMQSNLEYNRRIAYADGFFNVPEQQFVFGQLNLLSAEIDAVILNGNAAVAYIVQFNSPVPVWAINAGWVSGRYEIRADDHHRRAYRPAAQAPVVPQGVPQGHPNHRPLLRELFDQLGGMR